MEHWSLTSVFKLFACWLLPVYLIYLFTDLPVSSVFLNLSWIYRVYEKLTETILRLQGLVYCYFMGGDELQVFVNEVHVGPRKWATLGKYC
jgi:hypothetical protein